MRAHFVDGLPPPSCGGLSSGRGTRSGRAASCSRAGVVLRARGPRDPGHTHLRHASEAEQADLEASESVSAARAGDVVQRGCGIIFASVTRSARLEDSGLVP